MSGPGSIAASSTVGAASGGGGSTTAIVTSSKAPLMLVARIVTVPEGGASAGARYRPVGSTLPTSAEPPEIPSTVHITRGLSAITLANRRALVPAVHERRSARER